MVSPEAVRRGGAQVFAWSFAALAALSAASCKDGKDRAGTAPSASASAPVASASATAAPSATAGGGDDVKPVYRVDGLPPLPLAEKYCDAVRDTPRKRREACCPGAGIFAPTAECTRTLSSALRSGAVTLDAAAVEACAAAVTKDTEGCDWVSSVGAPTVEACLGIVHGTLKDGAVCRSNLECEEGLRCHGLGATRPGKCGAPSTSKRMCNIATDSLASFTGQDDMERHHPECAGQCVRRQCLDAVAPGGACKASVECGPKGACVAGKCAEGPRPGVGEACSDACGGGARCVKGKCAMPKAGGEVCEDDVECRGACERGDGGKAGHCAKQCPALPTPKKK
jgi:hypothetical protein